MLLIGVDGVGPSDPGHPQRRHIDSSTAVIRRKEGHQACTNQNCRYHEDDERIVHQVQDKIGPVAERRRVRADLGSSAAPSLSSSWQKRWRLTSLGYSGREVCRRRVLPARLYTSSGTTAERDAEALGEWGGKPWKKITHRDDRPQIPDIVTCVLIIICEYIGQVKVKKNNAGSFIKAAKLRRPDHVSSAKLPV